MFEFTIPLPLLVGFLSGTVLPLLVGLVTTRVTSGGLKAGLLALLSAVAGSLAELSDTFVNGTTFDVGIALLTALGAFLVGVGLHSGIYKPTKVSQKLQEVGARNSIVFDEDDFEDLGDGEAYTPDDEAFPAEEDDIEEDDSEVDADAELVR